MDREVASGELYGKTVRIKFRTGTDCCELTGRIIGRVMTERLIGGMELEKEESVMKVHAVILISQGEECEIQTKDIQSISLLEA